MHPSIIDNPANDNRGADAPAKAKDRTNFRLERLFFIFDIRYIYKHRQANAIFFYDTD